MEIENGNSKPSGGISEWIKEELPKKFQNLQPKEREKIQQIIFEQKIVKETANSYANCLSTLTDFLGCWWQLGIEVESVINIIHRLRNCEGAKDNEVIMCKNFDEQVPAELKADKRDFLRNFYLILREHKFPDCFFEKDSKLGNPTKYTWLILISLYSEMLRIQLSETSFTGNFVLSNKKIIDNLTNFLEQVVNEKPFETQKNYELISNSLNEIYKVLYTLPREKQLSDSVLIFLTQLLAQFKPLLKQVLKLRMLRDKMPENIKKYKCSSVASAISTILKIIQLQLLNQQLASIDKDSVQETLENFFKHEVVLMTQSPSNNISGFKFQLKSALLRAVAHNLREISIATSDEVVLSVIFELVALSKISIENKLKLESRILRIITDPTFIFLAFVRCFFNDLEIVNRLITEEALGFETFFALAKLLKKQAGSEITDKRQDAKVTLLLTNLRFLIEKSSKVLQFNVKPLLANLP